MGEDNVEICRAIFQAAVTAADPAVCLARHLPSPAKGRNVVVGAGKAAASMAAAVERAWGDASYEGVVVTRYGHGVPTRRIKVLEAGHPVPDAASEAAASEILAAVSGLKEEDLVVALISGGASSVMALPVAGLELSDKILVNRALLASGAPIGVMNRIRKQLSAVKGGKLAAACGAARVVSLVISDVPGDDPAVVGSGPTVYAGADVRMIATPGMALAAGAAVSAFPVRVLGDAIEGEAAEVGREMAKLALAETGPLVLLSGGETTVTIGDGPAGRGGRNMEFSLSLAVGLGRARNVWALAGDSDGIDGTEDAAGAVITPSTLERAKGLGMDAEEYLRRHDSYSFFSALGDLVVTGPTFTNVNDVRVILIR